MIGSSPACWFASASNSLTVFCGVDDPWAPSRPRPQQIQGDSVGPVCRWHQRRQRDCSTEIPTQLVAQLIGVATLLGFVFSLSSGANMVIHFIIGFGLGGG